METRYYEGCGREGPIRCIFLGEFHPVAGPKISCQFPEDYISKELFDSISAYIIPKPQIQKCTMTINALGHKIVGYPIRIDSSRYERNVYLFNLCFVCDSWSKTAQYEPVVKKLGEHLTIMEEDTGFVSGGSSKLPTLLAHLLHDLNTHRKATLVEGDTVMHLKVLEVRKDPSPVDDYDVPVLVSTVGPPAPRRAGSARAAAPLEGAGAQSQEHLDPDIEEPFEIHLDADWDLTTRQLLPFINGYNHVSKIASDTNVEKTLVKSCIQNLAYYGVVSLIPLLKFSNMYRATPNLTRLFADQELQRACLAYVARGGGDTNLKPRLPAVLEALCALQQGTTLRAVCERHGAVGAPGPGFDIVPVLLLQPRLPAVLEALCALQQGTTLRAVCERHGAIGAPGPGFDIVPVLLLQPRLPAVLEALCALQQGTTLRAVCERHAAVGAPGPGFDIVPVLLLQPRLPAVLEALCALQQGTTLRAVCERYGAVGAPGPGFDIRRLVVFAQVHDLIKCLKRYPVYIRSPGRPSGFTGLLEPAIGIRRLFTGRHCADEICCLARVDLPSLEQIIEDDPNVAIIWR